jgi:hypothetical protein
MTTSPTSPSASSSPSSQASKCVFASVLSQRTDHLDIGPQAGRVLLGAQDAQAKCARGIGQPRGLGDDLLAAVDGRHQPLLVVDQHQHAVRGHDRVHRAASN